MTYNKTKIFKQAKEIIKNEEEIHNIEELISYLPCGKSTFYNFFPLNSDELDAIKELINKSVTTSVVERRRAFKKSKNAVLQAMYYKLICSQDDRKKLSMQFIESENTNVNKNFDITKIYEGDEDDEVEQA